MNMLEDKAEYFHPAHESYFHLIQIEWDTIERLSSTIRQGDVGAMLSALGRDGQHATIAKFIQNELDAERGKVALLHQQGSQQFDLLRQQRAAATGSTHTRRSESLKIDITKYKAAEEYSLLRWFVELDDAIRACHIVDEQMQVTFAQANLAGRVKSWALGLKIEDPYVFG